MAVVIAALESSAIFAQGPAAVLADDKPAAPVKEPDDRYPPRVFDVTAAAEPEPALRIHLIPPASEKKPGNAATYYYRALLLNAQQSAEYKEQYRDNAERWLASPLDEATRKELRAWLDQSNNTLEELRTATHRETCEWDMRLQDLRGQDTVIYLLHDMQELRDLSRIVELQIHLAIEEGRHDDAIEWLQIGYQLGLDAAREKTIIQALIGIAIVGVMNHHAMELMSSPGSPNLYWALAELPRPVVDIRTHFRYDATIPFNTFPMLKDAETAQRTPEQWRVEWVKLVEDVNVIAEGRSPFGGVSAEAAVTALALRGYPIAKQGLIDMGMGREQVEAMPVGQVMAVYSARTHQRIADEMFKWTELPYWMAQERMRRSENVIERFGIQSDSPRREIIPVAGTLLPSMQSVMVAGARIDRTVSAMQAVEAIRMQLAAQPSELPLSLDILPVPVPYDNYYNRPFDYRVKESVGVIDLAVPPGTPPMPYREIHVQLREAR